MSQSKPLIGVALGGGVARGWAHIGVLNALSKAGFYPDIVVGTSIGSVVGGCYASGKLAELEEWVQELTVRGIFKYLDFNFSGSGLLRGNKLHDLLSERLDHIHIEQTRKKFVAVATEFGTGHEIWLKHGPLVPAMRASYAMPGIFKPVKINGRFLMDGALVNPVPVSVCRALGARLVIAVNLGNDYFGKGGVIPHEQELESTEEEDVCPDEDEQIIAATNRAPARQTHSALKLLHRQFASASQKNQCPGITEVMFDAFNITQDRIARARLAGDPPDFTISPILSEIGMFDFHRGSEAIPLGESAARRVIAELDYVVETLTRTATRS